MKGLDLSQALDGLGGADASTDSDGGEIGMHLKAMKKALDNGNMARAVQSFKDAVHQCMDEYGPGSETDESFEVDDEEF